MLQNNKPILIQDLGMSYPTETSNKKARYGIYKCCHCGSDFKTQTYAVKNGNTKSCGCAKIKNIQKSRTSHGMSNTSLYKVFHSMKARCTNKNDNSFAYYGARGISICMEWSESFIVFYEWAIVNGYSNGLTIDRIDNNGNYEPSNCRFVTRVVQSRNTRILYSNNKSGYRGVSFYKKRNTWMAGVRLNGKSKTIGYYITALEAAIAYDTYVIKNNLGHTLNGVIK